MKSFKEYAAKRGYNLDEASSSGSSSGSKKGGGNVDALTMDAKDFPIEECAPEVMKIHAAFQNPKVKNYFHELQKEQPDEKYFKFGKTPQHDRTAREIASTSREYAKNLKFEKHKLYLIGNTVKTWLTKRLHNANSMNPEFPCAFCEGTTEWKLGTSAHPNEVWVILHQGQKDGIVPKDAQIGWGDKATGEIVVRMAALRHLRKNVKINIQPFKMPVSSDGEGGGESGPAARPQFGVGMDKDKTNFSKNSESLYFDIDKRKVYDPTMLGISDLRSKKDEDGEGGEKKPAGGGFGGGDKPAGDKKPSPFGTGDKKPSGGFGGDKKPSAPKKPGFGGGDKGKDKKPAFGGDKKPSAPKKPAFGGDKGDKKPGFGGDKKPAFGGDKGGEKKKPFGK